MITIPISGAEVWANVKPLVLFIVGMVIYSMFIFKFYLFLSRRDIFELNIHKKDNGFKSFVNTLAYILEYIIIFPLFTSFWFVILTIIILVLAKSSDVSNILLVSMALVGSVRVTAYYNENLSKDLAKMLPFALLGIFLLDISFFSLSDSLAVILTIPNYWQQILYYFAFVVILELVLRILHGFYRLIVPEEESDSKKK